jgi:RecA-family ATPase
VLSRNPSLTKNTSCRLRHSAEAEWEEEHWAEETFHEPPAAPPVDPQAALRAKYHAFTPDEVDVQLRSAGKQRFLIAGMLPAQSIALMVGDPGIGKSPLLFQLGLCVAAGVPFFHHATTRGPVLFFDHENNYEEGNASIRTIGEFLGLPGRPKNFLYWNGHNKPKDWDDKRSVFEMIRDLRPKLVIIDTMSKAFPWIEEKNSDANILINGLMDAISAIDASVILTHHYKKNTGVIPGVMVAAQIWTGCL